jgi:Flp pilus assembly protein TadD
MIALAIVLAVQLQPAPNAEDLAQSKAQAADAAVADALARGDHRLALDLAQQALRKHPNDGSLLYDQGAALARLGQLDEAVAVLQRAQAAFPADQPWGRALAAYRRGLVLQELGRCDDARVAFESYQTLMNELDATLARQALSIADQCPSQRQNVSGRHQ